MIDKKLLYSQSMQTLSNWQNKANERQIIGTKQYNPEFIAILGRVII